MFRTCIFIIIVIINIIPMYSVGFDLFGAGHSRLFPRPFSTTVVNHKNRRKYKYNMAIKLLFYRYIYERVYTR